MIQKIKWNNHASLGNLELDFTKDDGFAYNTIILAGENGTGKTTILETLATFLNLGSFEPFEYIEYDADGEGYRISPEEGRYNIAGGFHLRRKLSDQTEKQIYTSRGSDEERLRSDTGDIRYYGLAYSKARSGFSTNRIDSTKTEQLDADKYDADQSDDFTRIKQLIVDVNGQDNSDWMTKSDSMTGDIQERKAEFIKTSRLFRFKHAFNEFFDELQFKDVDETDPNEKKISFEKHGAIIPLDDLSTGEKQIVFRGAHLLRNSRSIAGGTVLIDEPELSMHPRWQKKILKYYRDLFTSNGQQTVQMIIATHSSYVIQSALEDKENVLVIALNDNNGVIESKNITAPGVLPTITAAETNYLAFHVPTVDYHIELYGWLQNKTGKSRIIECDAYIAQQPQYDPAKYAYQSTSNTGRRYQTLPTYVRNAIDHPDPARTYTDKQLEDSIELLRELCR